MEYSSYLHYGCLLIGYRSSKQMSLHESPKAPNARVNPPANGLATNLERG